MKAPALGWVGQLLRPKSAPIPWGRAVRSGVAVVTPATVGMATGQLGPALIVSIGALAASMADQGGAYGARVRRVGVVAAGGALGFLIGGFVSGHAVLAILVVLLGGLISGLVSVLGNVASVASLQFLIYLIVASSGAFGNGPEWVPPLLYLAGVAWALALSLLGGIGRTTAPERISVAEVFRALALLMELSGTGQAESARQDLTTALNTAYDTVVSYRATAGGRDARVRRLAALLNAITPVVEATLTLVRDRAIIPLRVSAEMRQLATAVLHGTAPSVPKETTAKPTSAELESPVTLDALESGLRTVSAILAGAAPGDDVRASRPRMAERAPALRDAVSSGPDTWLPVIRLVLCLGVAEFVGLALSLERPYWIALTVAVTLKPDFGSVFARAVQRGLGTIVGVLIGTAVLAFLPFGVPVLVAIAFFAVMLPITIKRNYGMFATFLTPLIVLLLDLVHRGDERLVIDRVTDTAIGCAIVLIVGYLPWPNVWRSRSVIGDRVADATDAVLAYLRVALGADDGARSSLRRSTYRRLSDLRTVLQQALAEPPPASTQASAWWPAIVALERVADATTAVVVRAELGAPPPTRKGIDMVIGEMEELSAALRGNRRPRELPLPEETALRGVVAELRVAHSVLAGPAAVADVG